MLAVNNKENEIMGTGTNYKIPKDAKIGHVHLKVAELQRSLDFYCGLLGFELTTTYGEEAAFVSAGGYHHHIGLNVWFSKNAPPVPRNAVGLFHIAIQYPKRKDLAIILLRLQEAGYPISGASDHGVSEALYLEDPDGNGIELYWDKPKDQWPKKSDGTLEMYTNSLDIDGLMQEI
jgi:catechol 2,3-dioxygenase